MPAGAGFPSLLLIEPPTSTYMYSVSSLSACFLSSTFSTLLNSRFRSKGLPGKEKTLVLSDGSSQYCIIHLHLAPLCNSKLTLSSGRASHGKVRHYRSTTSAQFTSAFWTGPTELDFCLRFSKVDRSLGNDFVRYVGPGGRPDIRLLSLTESSLHHWLLFLPPWTPTAS
jgi:hypothetical protein